MITAAPRDHVKVEVMTLLCIYSAAKGRYALRSHLPQSRSTPLVARGNLMAGVRRVRARSAPIEDMRFY
jgi:hypothetical protein